jgi:hypothetical protein
MAKKKTANGSLEKLRDENKKARAITASLAAELNKAGDVMTKGRKKLDRVLQQVGDEHSTARAAVTASASTVLAQGLNELMALGARALAEWSQRSEGQRGHFAKNVGLYQSIPQSVIGFTIWMIELFTRSKSQMSLSLGRDIANKASLILLNLGTANMLRAVRYYLTNSVDEQAEAEAEKASLLNKIADLQKQIEAKK